MKENRWLAVRLLTNSGLSIYNMRVLGVQQIFTPNAQFLQFLYIYIYQMSRELSNGWLGIRS